MFENSQMINWRNSFWFCYFSKSICEKWTLSLNLVLEDLTDRNPQTFRAPLHIAVKISGLHFTLLSKLVVSTSHCRQNWSLESLQMFIWRNSFLFWRSLRSICEKWRFFLKIQWTEIHKLSVWKNGPPLIHLIGGCTRRSSSWPLVFCKHWVSDKTPLDIAAFKGRSRICNDIVENPYNKNPSQRDGAI